jgi:hypothetical protein
MTTLCLNSILIKGISTPILLKAGQGSQDVYSLLHITGDHMVVPQIPWGRAKRYVIYIHRPKKFPQNRTNTIFYSKLHMFLCTWK